MAGAGVGVRAGIGGRVRLPLSDCSNMKYEAMGKDDIDSTDLLCILTSGRG